MEGTYRSATVTLIDTRKLENFANLTAEIISENKI
jgi:hypothetical protein